MSHTGVWSVAWRRQARRKVEFWRGAKALDVEDAVIWRLWQQEMPERTPAAPCPGLLKAVGPV
jgi:hypothetical protein